MIWKNLHTQIHHSIFRGNCGHFSHHLSTNPWVCDRSWSQRAAGQWWYPPRSFSTEPKPLLISSDPFPSTSSAWPAEISSFLKAKWHWQLWWENGKMGLAWHMLWQQIAFCVASDTWQQLDKDEQNTILTETMSSTSWSSHVESWGICLLLEVLQKVLQALQALLAMLLPMDQAKQLRLSAGLMTTIPTCEQVWNIPSWYLPISLHLLGGWFFQPPIWKKYKYPSKWIMKPQIIGVDIKNVGVART